MNPSSNHRVEVTDSSDGVVAADAVRFVSVTTSGAGLMYVHSDHLGTPQKMTDGSQTLVWDAVYQPFGEAHSISGTASNNQRFPGQYFDTESEYHYNYFRDYDPTAGRYVQSDPIGLDGGLNTYGYVGGNPIINIDPWGLAQCTYIITNHSLVCTSNDGTETYSGSEGISSGLDECENNPSCAAQKNKGPVPPDNYNVSPNEKPGRNGWWAMQSQGWVPNASGALCRLGLTRCGFNIHLGTYSLGCITFDKTNPKAVQDYKTLTDMLKADMPNNTLTVIPSPPSKPGE